MAYASKYYDPVKRHEYYMKHRQLKGRKKRTSTADFNDEGKAVAAEIKEQIKAEQKEFLDKMSEIMKAKIKALREQMKGMPKDEIKAKVQALRDAYKEHKKKVKEYFNEKYAQELDGMRADPSFAKAKKKR